MYRAKSPSLPLSPGPKVWQWASPRGGGKRSVECPPGVSRSTVKPGKAPQRQTYRTKQIGVTGAFQTGYKCFGRTASIFPDIGERQSWIPARMRWYLTCHWRMGSACETREEYLKKKMSSRMHFQPQHLPRGCSQLLEHTSFPFNPTNFCLSFQPQLQCPILKEAFLNQPYLG